VIVREYKPGITAFDLTGLEAGVYFLATETGTGTLTHTFIRE
jgi:hypothetical protein